MGYGHQNAQDADDDRQRTLEAHLKKSGLDQGMDKEQDVSVQSQSSPSPTYYGRFSRPQGLEHQVHSPSGSSSAASSSIASPTAPTRRFARVSQPAASSPAVSPAVSPKSGSSSSSETLPPTSTPQRFARSATSAQPSVAPSFAPTSSVKEASVSSAPSVETQDTPSKDQSKDQPKDQKPKSFRQFSYADNEVETTSAAPTAFQLKGLRARRLVQEVADFKKWDAVETERMEREALRHPEKVIAQLQPVYQQDIRPFRAKGVHTLEEGVQKHPEEVVFLLRKKDQQRLRVVSREQAGGEVLLHKATLESLPAELCPFAKPSSWVVSTVAPTAPSPKP